MTSRFDGTCTIKGGRLLIDCSVEALCVDGPIEVSQLRVEALQGKYAGYPGELRAQLVVSLINSVDASW